MLYKYNIFTHIKICCRFYMGILDLFQICNKLLINFGFVLYVQEVHKKSN